MTSRRLLQFDIADRHATPRGMVAPDDFSLVWRDAPAAFPDNALAYCAEFRAERVLFTCHGDDIARLFEAPFLYPAQLRNARHVVSVPFERLAELEPPGRPSLIFSPGRAGSTLLARLLAACGAACASEPDMLTQVCCLPRESRLLLGQEMEVSLLRACLTSLCRVLGPAPFVKLRSQCNARPLPLLLASGGPAFLLMRRRESWAVSRHLAFGEKPVDIAATLRICLDAADKLLCQKTPAIILWYEDLRRDPLAVLGTCLPGRDFPAGALAPMQTDSQAGTSIARSATAAAVADPGFADAFNTAWRRARAGAEWSPATLSLLDAMEDPAG